jgi:hypothetical protein
MSHFVIIYSIFSNESQIMFSEPLGSENLIWDSLKKITDKNTEKHTLS